MRDFLLLMHGDAVGPADPEAWSAYFGKLREAGALEGGSAIGDGESFRKSGEPGPVSRHLVGYIRIRARDAEAARALIEGNPVFDHGGTVELRALPHD